MNLELLGWADCFAQAFERYAIANAVPGRVRRVVLPFKAGL